MLRLEAGKIYVRRDGKVTGAMEKMYLDTPNLHASFPFRDIRSSEFYMENGRYFHDTAAPEDIIAEYKAADNLEKRITDLEYTVKKLSLLVGFVNE